MAELFMYTPTADDLSSVGMGALRPSSCDFSEERNGESILTVTVPMWQDNALWRDIAVGYIVGIEVPTRTLPNIDMDTDTPTNVTQITTYRIKNAATKDERKLYKKKTGSAYIRVVGGGKKITMIGSVNADRYKIYDNKGNKGFITKSAVDMSTAETVTIPADNTGMESAVEAVKARRQYFRISEVTHSIDSVSFTAKHIFYDLYNNISYWRDKDLKKLVTPKIAIEGVLDGCMQEHDFDFVTDSANTSVEFDYWGMNPVKAMLDEDIGIADRFGLELVRDNFSFAMLARAGANRGAVIEYCKNLVSLDVSVDYDDVITHIIPVGTTINGNAKYLTHTESSGAPTLADAVISEHAADYPIQHWATVDFSGEGCTVTDDSKSDDVKKEMRALALKMFTDDHVDIPHYRIKVRHLDIGDTVEYSQYKGLDRMYLYDWVRVKHPTAGIDIEAEVVGMKYDCLTEAITEVELDNAAKAAPSRTVPSWTVPTIDGAKIRQSTVLASQLDPALNRAIENAVTPGEASDALGGINVGGNNLIPDSHLITQDQTWTFGDNCYIPDNAYYNNYGIFAISASGLGADSTTQKITQQLDISKMETGDTLSFSVYARSPNPTQINGTIRALVRFQTASGVQDYGFTAVGTNALTGEWARYGMSFNVPENAISAAVVLESTRNGTAYFALPMLSIGDDVIDWSPSSDDPSHGLIITAPECQSYIRILPGKVVISSPETQISIPQADGREATAFSVDKDGAHAEKMSITELETDSAAGAVNGGTYTVTSAGEINSILQDINGKWLNGDIMLTCAAGVTGAIIDIHGVYGNGSIYIMGGAFAGITVTGCGAAVIFDGCTISTAGTAFTVGAATVEIRASCTINAGVGIEARTGARVYVGAISHGGMQTVVNQRGGEVFADAPLTGGGVAPTTSTETTITVTPRIRTYRKNSAYNDTGDPLYQGDSSTGTVTDATLRRGCMWLTAADANAISGKTIVSATLKLKRISGIGGGGNVDIEIYGNRNANNTAPNLGTKFVTGSLANGATKNFDVTAAIAAIAAGTYKGLTLYSDRTGKFSGKTYTYGYAKFDTPTITITYV